MSVFRRLFQFILFLLHSEQKRSSREGSFQIFSSRLVLSESSESSPSPTLSSPEQSRADNEFYRETLVFMADSGSLINTFSFWFPTV